VSLNTRLSPYTQRQLRHVHFCSSETTETVDELPELNLGDGSSEAIIEVSSVNETVANITADQALSEAIQAQKEALRNEIDILERTLRRERLVLSKLKERRSESGKNGYFLVQAQVNDFLVSIEWSIYHTFIQA
jgi:hypothetical protein